MQYIKKNCVTFVENPQAFDSKISVKYIDNAQKFI